MKQINQNQKKNPDACRLKNAKKTDYNTRITEIEGKIPNITGLANTAALNAVETKIPNVSNLVKKQTMTQKYQPSKINK